MCLGIPGKIIEIDDSQELRMAKVDFGGVVREACLAYLPEAKLGDLGAKGSLSNIFILLIIGYVGAIGVATLSDSIIPYLGETLLKMPHRSMHIGFIEKGWIIHLSALTGIVIAYFRPTTKFSHAGHVLLSTWASLFHMIMAAQGLLSWTSYIAIFLFLFLAVWVPCCVSDILFPLLFIGKKGSCSGHCSKE